MKTNLATRIYLDTRRFRLAFTVATLGAIAFLGWNIGETVSVYQEISSLRSMMARQSFAGGGKSVSEVEYQKTLSRVAMVNTFLTGRSTEWLTLLDSLEKVVPDGVMLTEISPGTGKQEGYRISGYATDFRKVRQIFERMSVGDLFTDVFLVSQGKVRVTDSQQGVSFTLTAKVKR